MNKLRQRAESFLRLQRALRRAPVRKAAPQPFIPSIVARSNPDELQFDDDLLQRLRNAGL